MAKHQHAVLQRAAAVLLPSILVFLLSITWTAMEPEQQSFGAALAERENHNHNHNHRAGHKSTSDMNDDEGEWIHVPGSNGVMTSYRHLPGSNMVGLRGSAVVEEHISTILQVFLNTTKSKEWVSYLDHVEEYPTPKRNKHLIYQYFNMPWPIGDRDFLFERTVETDRRARVVSAFYQSVNHAVKPVDKKIVRGETRNTYWRFHYVDKKRTKIEVQSQLTAMVPINKWLINLMQKTYQKTSLLQLHNAAKSAMPHPEYAHW